MSIFGEVIKFTGLSVAACGVTLASAAPTLNAEYVRAELRQACLNGRISDLSDAIRLVEDKYEINLNSEGGGSAPQGVSLKKVGSGEIHSFELVQSDSMHVGGRKNYDKTFIVGDEVTSLYITSYTTMGIEQKIVTVSELSFRESDERQNDPAFCTLATEQKVKRSLDPFMKDIASIVLAKRLISDLQYYGGADVRPLLDKFSGSSETSETRKQLVSLFAYDNEEFKRVQDFLYSFYDSEEERLEESTQRNAVHRMYKNTINYLALARQKNTLPKLDYPELA